MITLAAAGLGCGDSDTSKSGEDDQTTTAQRPAARNSPARPLYPSCGVEAFGRPTVRPGPGGKGWRLRYQHPRPAQATAVGATSYVDLAERPPSSGRVRYGRPRTIKVRGREVELVNTGSFFVAQWVTKRARYRALLDGTTTTTLRKVIACTP